MTQRGVCSVCDKQGPLTKAGVMRYHRAPRDQRMYIGWDCQGSGQPPKSVVPDPITAAEARGYLRAGEVLRAGNARTPDWYGDLGDAAAYLDSLESTTGGETP